MFSKRRFGFLAVLLALMLAASAAEAAPKKFVDDDDSKEKEEPTKFLPDYDKLVEGREADWAYFPEGGGLLAKFKTVTVQKFATNSSKREAEYAADEAKEYFEQWLKKEGFEVAESGGALVAEGNVCHAWEPSGAARFWGGIYANPGVCLEVLLKDASGKLVGEIRHKARGSTVPDAVENGLEEVAEEMRKAK